MTTDRHLERDLPGILGEIATGRYPDYIDDVLTTTAERRQRPAWTFPERWLPVELVTQRAPVARMPWRQIGVLALVALLLAAAIVGYVASQQTRLPAPFGPARNGQVVYADKGDIYSVDPRTGVAQAIVTGPETDLDPRFSRDGTKVVFERRLDGGNSQVFVAKVDGSGLTLLTPEPVVLTKSVLGEHWDRYQFSPDGQTVVIASTKDGVPGITIAQSDGTGARPIKTGMAAAYEPSYRPPNGAEILFVGRRGLDANHGLFVIDASSGAIRTILAPSNVFDLALANWSPDGTRIAYARWGGPGEGTTVHARVISADGTGDRELPAPPDAVWSSGSEWSNDGTRLLIWRGSTPAFENARIAIVPADGSSPGTEIPYQGIINDGCCAAWEWAPDDSKVLGTPIGSSGEPLQQVIVDPVTGSIATAPWATTSDPTWQRVAP